MKTNRYRSWENSLLCHVDPHFPLVIQQVIITYLSATVTLCTPVLGTSEPRKTIICYDPTETVHQLYVEQVPDPDDCWTWRLCNNGLLRVYHGAYDPHQMCHRLVKDVVGQAGEKIKKDYNHGLQIQVTSAFWRSEIINTDYFSTVLSLRNRLESRHRFTGGTFRYRGTDLDEDALLGQYIDWMDPNPKEPIKWVPWVESGPFSIEDAMVATGKNFWVKKSSS
jgi:hypothetical protein